MSQDDILTLMNASERPIRHRIHHSLTNIHSWTKENRSIISIRLLKKHTDGMVEQTHRDSGNFVKVARLLVYMCPPTSMCTGALDLVSCAGVGMPWLLNGDTGDLVIMGLDMLERLSCKSKAKILRTGGVFKEESTPRRKQRRRTMIIKILNMSILIFLYYNTLHNQQ